MQRVNILVLLIITGICLGCKKEDKSSGISKSDSVRLSSTKESKRIQFLEIEQQPSASMIDYTVYSRDTSITGTGIYNPMLYDTLSGISTFRGGPFRDMQLIGNLDSLPTSISIDWVFATNLGRYGQSLLGRRKGWGGGAGWTGQPSLMIDSKNQMPIVYQGSLCGKIYRIDYNTGREIDSAIDSNNPIKGSVSLDPVFRNILYVGQGIRYTAESGARAYDLISGKQVSFQTADDRFALRRWGYFDSSPIAWGQFLLWPAENGILYKFLRTPNGIEYHSKLVYKVLGNPHLGVESSIAIYGHYGIIADNGGSILCIDLHTLAPMWYSDNTDDTDATPVIHIEKGKPFIYTGCEVDKQGSNGSSIFRKLDLLTGKEIWRYSIPCHSVVQGHHILNGGMLGTPLLGRANCEELIFTSFAYHKKGNSGVIVAFNQQTGKVVWSTELSAYTWSSPIGYTTKQGQYIMLLGDVSGNVYLIDGKNGTILVKKKIGSNFEASPIPWNNTAIIASRGHLLFRLSLH